jgi:hypothetical protein
MYIVVDLDGTVYLGDEAIARSVEALDLLAEHGHRCVFVTNTNDTDTLLDAVVWIEDEVAVGADIAIALDAAGVVAGDSGSAQAATIATEVDAPAGASFSAPTTKGAGLVVGDLEAGEAVAVWLRRTATNSDPVAADGVTIRIEGDTAA